MTEKVKSLPKNFEEKIFSEAMLICAEENNSDWFKMIEDACPDRLKSTVFVDAMDKCRKRLVEKASGLGNSELAVEKVENDDKKALEIISNHSIDDVIKEFQRSKKGHKRLKDVDIEALEIICNHTIDDNVKAFLRLTKGLKMLTDTYLEHGGKNLETNIKELEKERKLEKEYDKSLSDDEVSQVDSDTTLNQDLKLFEDEISVSSRHYNSEQDSPLLATDDVLNEGEIGESNNLIKEDVLVEIMADYTINDNQYALNTIDAICPTELQVRVYARAITDCAKINNIEALNRAFHACLEGREEEIFTEVIAIFRKESNNEALELFQNTCPEHLKEKINTSLSMTTPMNKERIDKMKTQARKSARPDGKKNRGFKFNERKSRGFISGNEQRFSI